MTVFAKSGKVDVTGVCDVWADKIDQARTKAPSAKGFHEHEKLLESKELDAVLVATPDHWHSRIAIDALNAGKDVYVEKPLTLKMEEVPPIVKAARVNDQAHHVRLHTRSPHTYLHPRDDYS